MFFFLSLACLKRYAELQNAIHDQRTIVRRAWQAGDISQIALFGTNSAYASIIVFLLYAHSAKAYHTYQIPQLLWGVGFLLLFWIKRIWLLALRGQVSEDPILFAIRNKVSLFITFLILSLCAAALLGSI